MIRSWAQTIRHAPGLSRCNGLWRRLGTPYRALLAGLAGRHGLPVVIGGYTMRLSPDVVSVSWETVEVRSYRAFAGEIRPGDVVYDVGAHFGTYTLVAVARGGPSTRVVAYEPCDLTRRYLMRHLDWNGAAGQVIVRPMCCGDRVGEARFFYEPGVPAGANGLVWRQGLRETRVPLTTLDREVDELGLTPSIVKIDVEGAELSVLRGASGLVERHRPRLLISLHPKPLLEAGIDCETVLTWLRDRGYRHEIVEEDQEVHVLARPR